MEIINHNPESIYKFSFWANNGLKIRKETQKKKKVIMKLLIFLMLICYLAELF